MTLVEGLTSWMCGPDHALEGGMRSTNGLHDWHHPQREETARAFIFGAGFTIAASEGFAPSFFAYWDPMANRVKDDPALPMFTRESTAAEDAKSNIDITHLIELVDQLHGRRAVVETVIAEPKGGWSLHPWDFNPYRNPMPQRAESAYRTLEQWQEAILATQPTHLSVLQPAGAAITVGRIIAEGLVSHVLSTNWDAYVELGCWLVGMEIREADRPLRTSSSGSRPRILQVFDCPEDVSRHRRLSGQPVLVKLHGGVRHIVALYKGLEEGRISAKELEARLRSTFLVSASDLTHWREMSQWVADLVADTLRTRATLLIGVSGQDPVTFRMMRERVREWERLADRPGPQTPAHPPTVAVDFNPTARLTSMMGACSRGVTMSFPVVKSDGRLTLRASYAWGMLQRLLSSLDRDEPGHRRLAARLTDALQTDVSSSVEKGPRRPALSLVGLLCDAVGPAARWAAIAEGRPPFDRTRLEPESRGWYAPWFVPLDDHPWPERDHLQQLVGLIDVLSSPHERALGSSETPAKDAPEAGSVDAWSGAVSVWEGHPLCRILDRACHRLRAQECAQERIQTRAQERAGMLEQSGSLCETGLTLLILPWPWEYRRGLTALALRQALRETLSWSNGRRRSALYTPRTFVLPVPTPPLELSTPRLDLGTGWAEVLCPEIHWLEEALR